LAKANAYSEYRSFDWLEHQFTASVYRISQSRVLALPSAG
jgi:hypothetical protein